MGREGEPTEFDVEYLVRTDSLQREGRVSRLFGLLTSLNRSCRVAGVVKSKDGFEYPSFEYKCASDRIPVLYIKIVLKLIEIQFFGLWYLIRHARRSRIVVVANHEFIFCALLFRLFTRKRVLIDLHEHYFAGLLHNKPLARLLFLRLFSGVIFANEARAKDFLPDDYLDARVIILRNFPDIESGDVLAPQYVGDDKLVVGIVNGATDERYGAAVIRALDDASIAKVVRVETFGAPVHVQTNHLAVRENGRYQHHEIFDHLKTIDVSMVFYDPERSLNNYFCEPNRFFEAYNTGKTIYAFDHPSLRGFYDAWCRVIDKSRFAEQLRTAVSEDAASKRRGNSNHVARRLLTYRNNLKGIELLAQD